MLFFALIFLHVEVISCMEQTQQQSIIIKDRDDTEWSIPKTDASTVFPALLLPLNNTAHEDQEEQPTIYLSDCGQAHCASAITLSNLQDLYAIYKKPSLSPDICYPNELFELARYCGSPEPLLKRLAFHAFRSMSLDHMHSDMHAMHIR